MEHLTWRKSSYCPDGNDCVEVAEIPATWRKSSFSGDNPSCVEVADRPGGTAVRDSKNPTGAVLTFNVAQWSAFTSAVRTGEFD
jgi:hypothetical protein